MTHVDFEKYYYYEITKNTLKIVAKVVTKQDRIMKKVMVLLRDRRAVEALYTIVEKHNFSERKLIDAEEKHLVAGAIFYEKDYEAKKEILEDYKKILREKLMVS